MERGQGILFGNETVTMLDFSIILSLILVRLGSIRATTLQNGAGMVSSTAMIHTIRHEKRIAWWSDNGKIFRGIFSSFVT
jgi:hypothetical protein